MSYILDTHALIWALYDPSKLSSRVLNLLSDYNNTIFVSVASLWELQIKQSIGKIDLPEGFFTEVLDIGYDTLNVTPKHVESLFSLPLLHRDPFDRMLIAQAKSERITLISHDKDIVQYKNVKILKF